LSRFAQKSAACKLLAGEINRADPIGNIDTRAELLGDEDVWETSLSASGDTVDRPEQASVSE